MPSLQASSVSVAASLPPQSPPTTAAVLEFACLFTHDLRRKQKRWQDGRLKYHTFNKRVMVYDERGNFVGDMHWRADYEFDEGEEVQLERGGVIVQVSNCIARNQQDLSELVDKRAQEVEQRRATAVSRTPVQSAPSRPSAAVAAAMGPVPQPEVFQPRHRPLRQVLGTSSGHHGRALIPSESPFEQRHRPADTPNEQDSPARTLAKRRRHEDSLPSKNGYAQALFGATLSLSVTPISSAPPRTRPVAPPQEPVRRPIRHFVTHDQGSGNEREPSSSPPTKIPAVHKPTALGNRKTLARPNVSESTQMAGTSNEVRGHEVIDVPSSGHSSHCSEVVPVPPVQQPSRSRHSEQVNRGMQSAQQEQIAKALRSKPKESPCENGVSREQAMSREKQTGMSRTKQRPYDRKESIHESEVQAPTRLDSGREVDCEEPHESGRGGESQKGSTAEPKTELRIRSRQKRGLLMMSETTRPSVTKRPDRTASQSVGVESARTEPEGDVSPPSSPEIHADETQQTAKRKSRDRDTETEEVLEDTSANARKAKKARLKESEESTTQEVTRALLDEVDNPVIETETATVRSKANMNGLSIVAGQSEVDSSAIRQSSYRREIQKADEILRLPEGYRSDPSESEDAHAHRESTRTNPSHRAKGRYRILDDDADSLYSADESSGPRRRASRENENEKGPEVPVGPRLAALGRKSVKSKELIGFAFDKPPVPRATALATDAGAVVETPSQEKQRENRPASATLTRIGPDRQAGPVSDGLQQPPVATSAGTGKIAETQGGVAKTSDQPASDSAKNYDEQSPDDLRPLEQYPMQFEKGVARIHEGAEKATERPREPLRRHMSAAATPASEPPGLPPIQTVRRTASDLGQLKPAEMTGKSALAGGGSGAVCNPQTGAPVRIANPATRGRKAALKSDAAGQIPQPVLPPNLPAIVQPIIIMAAELAEAPPSPPKRTIKKMTFPGFVSANNAGPWSREAHDLLETGRPV